MPGSGLVSMLDWDRMDDLARLYRVFGKVPLGMKELKKAMKESVKERGEKINEGFQDGPSGGGGGGPPPPPGPSSGGAGAGAGSSMGGAGEEGGGGEKDPKGKGKGKEGSTAGGGGGASAAGALQSALRWVQEVLDLKDKFDKILREAFSGDKTVQTAINEVSSSRVVPNRVFPPSFFSSFRRELELILVISFSYLGWMDCRPSNPSSTPIRSLQNISRCSSMRT